MSFLNNDQNLPEWFGQSQSASVRQSKAHLCIQDRGSLGVLYPSYECPGPFWSIGLRSSECEGSHEA